MWPLMIGSVAMATGLKFGVASVGCSDRIIGPTMVSTPLAM